MLWVGLTVTTNGPALIDLLLQGHKLLAQSLITATPWGLATQEPVMMA